MTTKEHRKTVHHTVNPRYQPNVKKAGAHMMLRKQIVILIVAGLFILPVMGMGCVVDESESPRASVLVANDFAIDIEGFTMSSTYYSSVENFNRIFIRYTVYGLPPPQIASDMLFDESISTIVLVKYVSDDGWRGFVEIFEYATEQVASVEYENQKDAVEDGERSIYSRYSLD
ncbi:MAG: hypothetical protein RTU30_15715, partial [Candidatus Thorarchaeota archaeon]